MVGDQGDILKKIEYSISDEKEKLQFDRVYRLLKTTYWAKNWSRERIRTSMEHSICFGAYAEGVQVGFARCVTDYATVYWVCDVVVEPEYRGQGIGKALVQHIVDHEELKPLMGILSTKDAKTLYSPYGFRLSTNGFMLKSMPRETKIDKESCADISHLGE